MAKTEKSLRFGIPKGSLEAQTLELLRKSGWRISVNARSYIPNADDPSLTLRLLRPQEMPRYIADGSLDAGITGRDWVAENGVDLVEVETFVYSKVSLAPSRWVLVVPDRSPVKRLEDLDGKRVATEMVNFTRRLFARRKVKVEIEFSWGATEAKVADGLVDAAVDVTETGNSIRANGLRIVEELLHLVARDGREQTESGPTRGSRPRSNRSPCWFAVRSTRRAASESR